MTVEQYEAIEAIVESSGFHVIGRISGSGFLISNEGAEIRRGVTRDSVDHNWVVDSAERAEPFVFEFEAPDFDDVLRFLLMEFSHGIRSALGHAELWLEGDIPAPGFTLQTNGDRIHVLQHDELRGTFAAGFIGRLGATRFTWLAAHPVDELLESYRAADGMPLLGRFVG